MSTEKIYPFINESLKTALYSQTLHVHYSTQWSSNIQLEEEEKHILTRGGLKWIIQYSFSYIIYRNTWLLYWHYTSLLMKCIIYIIDIRKISAIWWRVAAEDTREKVQHRQQRRCCVTGVIIGVGGIIFRLRGSCSTDRGTRWGQKGQPQLQLPHVLLMGL